MKLAITIFAIICLSSLVRAQQTTKTIYKDTINVRGFIYSADGSPAIAHIYARSGSIKVEGQVIESDADSTGHFELYGISPTDTLSILSPSGGIMAPVRGARYLIINLRGPNPVSFNSLIVVTAIRNKNHKTPQFKISVPSKDTVTRFVSYEAYAEYPGGPDKFAKFIQSRLHYPSNAVEHNIEGTVELGFVIDKMGYLINYKVLKGLGYGCDEEAISALKASPKWKPQIFYGKAVNHPSTISVTFKLADQPIAR